MSNLIDVTGQRFGRLTVQERAEQTPGRQATWRCVCDCGNTTTVTSQDLRLGHTKSCGCIVNERIGALRRTHGRARTPEYVVWTAMKGRCLNPANKSNPRYGGRGIDIDPRWNRFEQFYADMGPRPSADHSVERIDNAGPYSPENCRWATASEQMRNKRSNRMLTLNGRTQPVIVWAEELGLRVETIRHRLWRGWSDADALRTGKGPR